MYNLKIIVIILIIIYFINNCIFSDNYQCDFIWKLKILDYKSPLSYND